MKNVSLLFVAHNEIQFSNEISSRNANDNAKFSSWDVDLKNSSIISMLISSFS